MAVRIPVVISQHERRSGSIADYEEQLITRIVMESGLDATLIADLKSIALETTDHLCIEGLKGDFALATWESVDYVCLHLHRLGIPSLELVPVDGSTKKSSGDTNLPPKKIYLISLLTSVPIDSTIQTLKGLLLARSTPVFSIGAPIHRTPKGPVGSQVKPNPLPPNTPTDTNAALPANVQVPNPVRFDSAAPSQNAAATKKDTTDSDEDFPNIDQLMDELDQFQL